MIDHTCLLVKLEHCGIRGITDDLFKSYLTNKVHFVLLNGDANDANLFYLSKRIDDLQNVLCYELAALSE